jgi:GT2 family glycosyltransferase
MDQGSHADSDDVSTLAVLVVNYASSHLLRDNLAVTAAEVPGAIVVVIDNWSGPEERAVVSALCRDRGWHLVALDVNGGFGAGMDAGVRRARELGAEWLLLVNPDLELPGSAVRMLLGAVRSQPNAVVAPRIMRPDGTLWTVGHDLYLDDGRMRSLRRRLPEPARRRFWLSGACLMLGVELWDRVGGFAPEYFLYWEDVEFSHRALDAGAELRVIDDAVGIHAEGGTHRRSGATEQQKSDTYYYYNTRNRLVYAARNLDDDDIRAWMANAWTVAREILLQGGRRQLLRGLSPIGAVRRGTRDGLARAAQELRDRAIARPDPD